MMHALRPSSLFRPASRPSSPAPPSVPASPLPEGAISADKAPRAINKLSLTSFRRPSPAPAQSVAPAASIVQDGHYLEVLQLKLSEAVTKALAQPTGPAAAHEQVNGRRAIPQGRGHNLGLLISTELNAARENPHLRKAIIRSLHRPLSILLTNLSAHLLPLLNSPAFLTPAAPTPQAPNPNPTQLHALAYAAFAGELLEDFDDMGLGLDAPDGRGDGLKPIRESLTSIITRVINPLTSGIKEDLSKLIEGLENAPSPAAATGTKATSASKTGVIQHPSIVSLQTITPVYAKALSRYFTTSSSQSQLATLLISIVWRGLVALSNRALPTGTPPNSPLPIPAAIKKRRSVTPPTTPPSTRLMLKLPPSRPPSPPQERAVPSVASDARQLLDLLSTLPRPSPGRESTRLACEAVEDAFDGLKALVSLLEVVHPPGGLNTSKLPVLDGQALVMLTADMPTLVALPVLLQVYVHAGQQQKNARSVANMLGLSEGQYRAGCLTGFGRAEECTIAVGQRVLEVMKESLGDSELSLGTKATMSWLENEVQEAENSA